MNHFTEEQLAGVAEIDEILYMDEKIQEFRDRVNRGEKEALAQIEDVMNT